MCYRRMGRTAISTTAISTLDNASCPKTGCVSPQAESAVTNCDASTKGPSFMPQATHEAFAKGVLGCLRPKTRCWKCWPAIMLLAILS